VSSRQADSRVAEAKTAYRKLLTLKPDFPEHGQRVISHLLIHDRWIQVILEGLKKAGWKEA